MIGNILISNYYFIIFMLCEYLIFLNKTILIRMKAWDFKNIAIFFSYQDSADEVLDTICFV